MENDLIIAFFFLTLIVAAFAMGTLAGYTWFRIWHARRGDLLAEHCQVLEWQRDEAWGVANRVLNQKLSSDDIRRIEREHGEYALSSFRSEMAGSTDRT